MLDGHWDEEDRIAWLFGDLPPLTCPCCGKELDDTYEDEDICDDCKYDFDRDVDLLEEFCQATEHMSYTKFIMEYEWDSKEYFDWIMKNHKY